MAQNIRYAKHHPANASKRMTITERIARLNGIAEVERYIDTGAMPENPYRRGTPEATAWDQGFNEELKRTIDERDAD